MSGKLFIILDQGGAGFVLLHEEKRYPADGGTPVRVGEIVVLELRTFGVANVVHDAGPGHIYVIVTEVRLAELPIEAVRKAAKVDLPAV